MIERAVFDDAAGTLTISFRPTGKYIYDDVPSALFDELCRAASAGSYFNEHIKDQFRFRRDPARRRFGPGSQQKT